MVDSYRVSLNICIGFLEDVKGIPRERVCFDDLDKENPKNYLVWMVPCGKIMYFEDAQSKALLEVPGKVKRSGRRNQMLLILGYNTTM